MHLPGLAVRGLLSCLWAMTMPRFGMTRMNWPNEPQAMYEPASGESAGSSGIHHR